MTDNKIPENQKLPAVQGIGDGASDREASSGLICHYDNDGEIGIRLEAIGDLASRREELGDSASPSKGVVRVQPNPDRTGKQKELGGSASSDFNKVLIERALEALPPDPTGVKDLQAQVQALVGAMRGIAPLDEIEGMLATQMLVTHSVVIECFRRSHIEGQPFDRWREYLNQANKLSRSCVTLVEALNRHRGKGQQKVTVEHVHVNQGGQAIVGTVDSGSPNNQTRGAARCRKKH